MLSAIARAGDSLSRSELADRALSAPSLSPVTSEDAITAILSCLGQGEGPEVWHRGTELARKLVEGSAVPAAVMARGVCEGVCRAVGWALDRAVAVASSHLHAELQPGPDALQTVCHCIWMATSAAGFQMAAVAAWERGSATMSELRPLTRCLLPTALDSCVKPKDASSILKALGGDCSQIDEAVVNLQETVTDLLRSYMEMVAGIPPDPSDGVELSYVSEQLLSIAKISTSLFGLMNVCWKHLKDMLSRHSSLIGERFPFQAAALWLIEQSSSNITELLRQAISGQMQPNGKQLKVTRFYIQLLYFTAKIGGSYMSAYAPSLMASCASIASTVSDAQAIVDAVLLSRCLDRNPLISEIVSELWAHVFSLATDEVRARHLQMMTSLVAELEPLRYHYTPSLWNYVRLLRKIEPALKDAEREFVFHSLVGPASSLGNYTSVLFFSFLPWHKFPVSKNGISNVFSACLSAVKELSADAMECPDVVGHLEILSGVLRSPRSSDYLTGQLITDAAAQASSLLLSWEEVPEEALPALVAICTAGLKCTPPGRVKQLLCLLPSVLEACPASFASVAGLCSELSLVAQQFPAEAAALFSRLLSLSAAGSEEFHVAAKAFSVFSATAPARCVVAAVPPSRMRDVEAALSAKVAPDAWRETLLDDLESIKQQQQRGHSQRVVSPPQQQQQQQNARVSALVEKIREVCGMLPDLRPAELLPADRDRLREALSLLHARTEEFSR
eukprot:m51a1_g535 hypothetical protein (733) ;mRNA; f:387590-390817